MTQTEPDPWTLPLWVIYDHPTDFPDHFVARKWIMDRPTDEILTAETLDEIRGQIRGVMPGGFRLGRIAADNSKIVETWI